MTIQRVRRLFMGTAGEWEKANPLLQQGDLGICVDTGEIRVGNGHDRWTSLQRGPSDSPIGLSLALSASHGKPQKSRR